MEYFYTTVATEWIPIKQPTKEIISTEVNPMVSEGYKHAGYFGKFLEIEKLPQAVKAAVEALKGWKFDAIAFRGMSGTIISVAVALKMKKPMIMVRKSTSDNHSGMWVEGFKKAKTYIILDDFISSGETARTIVEKVKTFSPSAKCLGLLPVQSLTVARVRDNVKYYRKPFGLEDSFLSSDERIQDNKEHYAEQFKQDQDAKN